ncbi:MAG: hypothetical protein ABSH33_09665 [Steroidobacteraceae bacterium]|jgi:hypothetical protein
MNLIAVVVLSILGLVLVAGVPAMLYFLLPRTVLEAAMRHGRYAGLGARTQAQSGVPGQGAMNVNRELGLRR